MILKSLLEGFTLGASTGVVCFGTCAPFLIPYLMMDPALKRREKSLRIMEFLLGRLTAYLLFGWTLGWISSEISTQIPPSFHALTLLTAASLMIFFALTRSFPKNPLCQSKLSRNLARFSPFLFGLFLGLNICPPFIVAMARILELGTPALGALFFFSFFISSSIYLIPLFIIVPWISTDRIRSVGIGVSLWVGIYYLAMGLLSL